MASPRESSDEEEPEGMDDGRRQQMIRDVLGDRASDVSTRRTEEDKSGSNAGRSGSPNQLSLSDLLAAAAKEQSPANKQAARARKAFLDKIHKGNRVGVPLAPAQAARTERKVASDKANVEVSKWTAAVKTLREAPTLDFRKQSPRPSRRSVAAIASELKPETDLEHNVESMLAAAGVYGEEPQVAQEDSAIESITDPQEGGGASVERQARIAKLRRLMFYHEQKAKRLRKIKSKAYHKILRKSAIGKVNQSSGDQKPDRDDQAAALLEEERRRAEERLTLKHKNTSRWSRRAIRKNLGRFNKGIAEALTEQNRIASNLTTKRNRRGIDEEAGDANNDEWSEVSTGSDDNQGEMEEPTSTIAEALKSIVYEKNNTEEGDADGASGLMKLPFMKRSAERKQAQVVHDAQSLLEKLEENDAWEGRPDSKPTSKLGRAAFGSKADEKNWDEPEATDPPLETESNDDLSPSARSTGERKEFGAKWKPREEENDKKTASDFLAQDFDPIAVEVEAGFSDEEESMATRVDAKAEAQKRAQDNTESAEELNLEPALKDGKTFRIELSVQGQEIVSSLAGSTSQKKKKKKKKRLEKDLAKADIPAEKSKEGAEDSGDRIIAGIEGNVDTSNQADLIAAAFAGDDVMDDFSAIKEAELNDELPKSDVEALEKEIAMPGWGRWSGQAPTRRQKRKLEEAITAANKAKEAAAAARKDANKKSVIISEKVDRKALKYTATALPHPFSSRQHFERSMRQPLAPEMNTDSAFRSLVRPKVLRSAGQLISPPRMSRGSGSVADAPAIVDVRSRDRA